MRASDATEKILAGSIDGIVNGIDIVTENMLARRMKIRKIDSGARTFSEQITGYDKLPPRGFRSFTDAELEEEQTNAPGISVETVFDVLNPTNLKLLVRNQNADMLGSIEAIARRGDILTTYPFLTRAILSSRYGGGRVGAIKKVDGKVEALLNAQFGMSATDIVDTGETARVNNLTIGANLFESYPTAFFSDRSLSEKPSIRSLRDRFIDISNNLYYSSPEYRNKFPRG